ncbi:MAG: cache domain-containing protein [Proteobacteria bacterium]|nr:cache domain-containing protein [Pseudomonadota bacterium]
MKLRDQLTISFVAIVLFVGVSSALIGRYFIAAQVVKEAERRVRSDLLVASDVYHDYGRELTLRVNYLAQDQSVVTALDTPDPSLITGNLIAAQKRDRLDVLMIVDEKGNVFFRANNPLWYGDSLSHDQMVKRGLAGESYSAVQILSPGELRREGTRIGKRGIRNSGNASMQKDPNEDAGSGMVMRAIAPVRDEKRKIRGLVLGGIILNENYDLVDRMVRLVFRGEKYDGKNVGIASISQGGIRISTNVLNESGSRAVSTRIDPEVYSDVIQKGKLWLKRAWSVDAWYITAYEPILDIDDKIIGTLGVGILEDKYEGMKQQIVRFFLGLTAGGMAVALLISYLLARSLTEPIKDLVMMAERVERGDYEAGKEVDLKMKRRGSEEIVRLMDSFDTMVKKILRQKGRLENIIQSVGEGIFVFDREGRITIFNRAAERITGFKHAVVAGKSFSSVFENFSFLMENAASNSVNDGAGKTIHETSLISKAGREIPVSVNVELIRSEEGNMLGGVVTFRDITEEKTLDQMKKDFVSSVTHDLKNPLVPILGFSARILQGKLGIIDKRMMEAVQIIHSSGEKIMNLIENFLSASKIEGGKLELEFTPVSLQELVKKYFPLIDLYRRDKEIKFAMVIPDDLPFVRVDKVQLERVLGNLIENAAKFTSRNGKIILRAVREGQFVRIDVEDTGIGIPEEFIHVIFDKYKKVKGTTIQGTGLGLYIARSIVEAHGGKIWVNSCTDKGSCFSFTLPVAPEGYAI